MPKSLHQRFEELGVLERYRRLIGELKASFGNFQVVEPLIEVYPDDYFADVGHLNTKGDLAYQAAYSRRIAQHALSALP